ncbi:MAG: hypothetical protein JSS02_19130, partial [Planctomycetes bacterium]|nr:hypothetical protein [Planctomycetota bacterium]
TQHNTPIVEQERNRIGLGYLSRFKATFDFKKRSLYLTPVARSEPTDGFRMRVGIELATRKSDIEVRHVFPDRLAASAGVRPGDIVVEVDGIAAGKLGKFEIERRLVCNDDVRVRFRRSKRETNLTSEYTIEFERLSQTKRTWKMTSAGAGETKH